MQLLYIFMVIFAMNLVFLWSARHMDTNRTWWEVAHEAAAGKQVVTFFWKDILPEVTPIWVEVRVFCLILVFRLLLETFSHSDEVLQSTDGRMCEGIAGICACKGHEHAIHLRPFQCKLSFHLYLALPLALAVAIYPFSAARYFVDLLVLYAQVSRMMEGWQCTEEGRRHLEMITQPWQEVGMS
jgi:hypothetical protein